MHHAAADHRARRVIFGRQAGQLARSLQSPVDEHRHRPAPHVGIAAVGQHPRHQVGQDDAAAGRIGEVGARRLTQRFGLGIGAHILCAVGEQHPHRVAALDRFAILDMIETARHLEQLAQRDLAARVARLAPRCHRHRRVDRQPPVRHHQPDQHRRHALGDRPGQEFRVRPETRRIAFRDDFAVAHHQQRAGVAHRRIVEQGVDRGAQRSLAHCRVARHMVERLRIGRAHAP